MVRWIGSMFVSVLLLMPIIGCGSGELGPADPDETPQVSDEDVQNELEQTTPEQYKNHYK